MQYTTVTPQELRRLLKTHLDAMPGLRVRGEVVGRIREGSPGPGSRDAENSAGDGAKTTLDSPETSASSASGSRQKPRPGRAPRWFTLIAGSDAVDVLCVGAALEPATRLRPGDMVEVVGSLDVGRSGPFVRATVARPLGRKGEHTAARERARDEFVERGLMTRSRHGQYVPKERTDLGGWGDGAPVHVIGPTGSHGVNDVLSQVRTSYSTIHVQEHDVSWSSDRMPETVDAILRAIPSGEPALLVRGGGSPRDLLPFDDVDLAVAMLRAQQRGVPVVTGVGHTADRTLADLVAGETHGTPTSAGAALVQTLKDRRGKVLRDEQKRREVDARHAEAANERAWRQQLDEARADRLRAEGQAANERVRAQAAEQETARLWKQLSETTLDAAGTRLETVALAEALLLGVLGLAAGHVAALASGAVSTALWVLSAVAFAVLVFVTFGPRRARRPPNRWQLRRAATSYDDWYHRARSARTPREIRRLAAGVVLAPEDE